MQKIYLLAKLIFINGIIYYNDLCIELFFAEVSCYNKILTCYNKKVSCYNKIGYLVITRYFCKKNSSMHRSL